MTQRQTMKYFVALGSVALFLTALCWLPYRVPLSASVSDSYYFGYNNRAAECVVGLGAVLLAIFSPRVRPARYTGKKLTRDVLFGWLAITLLLAVTLQVIAHGMDGFGEGIYLIDRVKLLATGRRPYFNFEYPYGALFLYGPVWTARLLHLSAGDGYAIFWVLNCVAGTYLLYVTLRSIDLPEGKQRAAFTFFSAYGLFMMPAGGVNYTLFRYVPSCFFAVLLYRLSKRHGYADRNVLPMLLAIPCAAFLLLLSPELAISFGVGVAVYFAVWGELHSGRHLAAYAGMLAGLVAVGWVAMRLGVFLTMATYSTGAYNLPIILGPHILLFFIALGLAACYVGSCIRRRGSSALLMLICTSAAGLAGALGRCDRVHTLMNPFGIVIAAALLETSSTWFNRLWWWGVWFVFFWMLLPGSLVIDGQVFGKMLLRKALQDGMETRSPAVTRWMEHRVTLALGPEAARQKIADMRAAATLQGDLDIDRIFDLPQGTVSEAPFGFTPSRFGTTQTPQIDEGYFFEHQNMGIPAAVERKVNEMRVHPERPLLLLPDREISCGLVPEVQRGEMSGLFSVPYTAAVRHPESVTEPLCAFIRDHYRKTQEPTPEHFGYAVWQHK